MAVSEVITSGADRACTLTGHAPGTQALHLGATEQQPS